MQSAKSLARLLAWRYLTRSSDKDSISTMVLLCLLGIGVGSFALTLVSAVARGAEYTLHQKMQGLHADIIIRGYGEQLNVSAIQTILTRSFPEVDASTPSTIEHVMVKGADDSTPSVCIIKAVDPVQEMLVTRFNHMIATPAQDNNNLSLLLAENQILIGNVLASELGIAPGDEIELWYADNEHTEKRTFSLQSTVARVSGLFSTGIDECDSSLIVSSFDFLSTMFPESGPTQLNLRCRNKSKEQILLQKLTEEFKLETLSWHHLYPALMSALTLEKYALICIIMLVLLVASINTIALLLMHITRKQSDIALLKAMGASNRTIEHIFMCMGMTITITAAAPGILLAALISYLLNQYRLIPLPDAYYIAYLPAHLDASMISIILLIICVISSSTILLATRKVRTINISHVLRFEG